jgi:hypothetical protein
VINPILEKPGEYEDFLEEKRNEIYEKQCAAIERVTMELLLTYGIIKDKSEYKNPENLRTILKKKGYVVTIEWTDIPNSFGKTIEIIISKVVDTKKINFKIDINL